MKRFKLIGILSLLAFVGYGQNSFEIAKNLDTIYCDFNRQQSYALYLPNAYQKNAKLPIIYLFDPLARGSVAVEVFREAAEEYGYILVSSNNSRNGSWDTVFTATDAVFADTEKKLLYDTSRIYLAGFSGGSRAALAIAVLTENKVRGVIGCGAGFPPVRDFQPTSLSAFEYIGMVGHEDMNLLEHQLLVPVLDSLAVENTLFIFEGGHQWPSSEIVNLALLQLQLGHGKDLPKHWWLRYDSLIYENSLKMSNLGFHDYALQQLSTWSAGGTFSAKVRHLQDSLSQCRSCRRQSRANRQIQEIEKESIQKYSAAFNDVALHRFNSEITLKWWMSEIDNLNMLAGSEQNPSWSHYVARMLNLIAARSAESAFRNEEIGDFELASKLNYIWIYAAPSSAYPYWYRAKIYALQGMSQRALEYLEKALEHGMEKRESLMHPAFSTLASDPKFKILMNQLSAHHRSN